MKPYFYIYTLDKNYLKPSFEIMEIICMENHRKVKEVQELIYIKNTTNIYFQLECLKIGNYFNVIYEQYQNWTHEHVRFVDMFLFTKQITC